MNRKFEKPQVWGIEFLACQVQAVCFVVPQAAPFVTTCYVPGLVFAAPSAVVS